MAVRMKVEGIDRDLTEMLESLTSESARSKMLADTARDLIADADNRNTVALGRLPRKEIWVDGQQGGAIERVRADGVILVEYKLVDDVLFMVQAMLRENSPVGKDSDKRPGHPGLYRDSHVLTADGTVIELKRGEPVPEAEEYVFLNTQPYARRIERGWSPQAPTGVYQTTAALLQRRYGNIARIGFDYRAPDFGAVSGWAGLKQARDMAKAKRGGNPAAHSEWLRRQPAINVIPR